MHDTPTSSSRPAYRRTITTSREDVMRRTLVIAAAALLLATGCASPGTTQGSGASGTPAAPVAATPTCLQLNGECITTDVPTAEPAGTMAQQNALRAALSYLEAQGYSRLGLIDQLSSKYGDQFSVADATWAVDHTGANWNEQAVRAGRSYLEAQGYSRAGLIDQLSSRYGDRFTRKQATYAADKLGL